MYHLYHTDAIILGSSPSGEGSKIILLFTREFGLLSATARSVREERSKLRYGLQDLSYSEVSLVRGRECWRVTHALQKKRLFPVDGFPPAAHTAGRICLLLRRLLAGEEKHEALFFAVLGGLEFMGAQDSLDAISGAEIVLMLRVLHLLGYLAPCGELLSFFSPHALWSESVIENALALRARAVAEINHSLRHTQL